MDLRRWAAVVIGLLGALVIIRPGGGALGWASLLPLSSAAAYTLYLLITRKLAGSKPPLVTQTVTAVVAALLASARVADVIRSSRLVIFM